MRATHPLMILPLLMKWRRPSRISDMPAIAQPFWIGKGYDGMTFFGHIITHSQQEADHLNSHYDSMKNHEMIHLCQARATRNSWLCFYLRYVWYWLTASRYRRHIRNAGYVLNPFEMEAYLRMSDLGYPRRHPDGCTEWKRYAALPLAERLRIMLRWQQNR